MPFSTGTANTPTQLMKAIDSLVTANGWTRLRGEPDEACASPKAARYWRLLWIESEDINTDFRILNDVQFRTTLGGSAITGTWSSRGIANGALPGYFETGDIDDMPWWMTLDCGSPTIVREVVIQCDNDIYAPKDFLIQWSHDNRTWTTMFEANNLSWVYNETKTFQFDDGYVHADHYSATECRRCGEPVDTILTQMSPTSHSRHMSNDEWAWQGPGYDADRRVYVSMVAHARINSSTSSIRITASPEFDSNIDDFYGQIGSLQDLVTFMFDVDPVTYWIYVNNHRILVVTKTGVDDYTSCYAGFVDAFAPPDDYPSPLAVIGTADLFSNIGDVNNKFSMVADPGDNAGKWRRWDGSWETVHNRPHSSLSNLYFADPSSWTWPYHVGAAGDGGWPYSPVGDNDTFGSHWLNNIEPTAQNDIAIYPVIIQNDNYGNIGALHGVFCIPGGTLVQEQVFSISGTNYRVFPNRTRREGCNWMAVRED